MLNKIAKVHTKMLFVMLIGYLLFAIPKVMAMSNEEAAVLNPYGIFATIAGIFSFIVQFAQRKFSRIKRVFDLVVSVIALVFTSPLILLGAIGIKVFSPSGPVFYLQRRVGKDGKVFNIIKLRSMRPDAENGTGAVWAKGDDDPRLIPFVGAFLRKTHIDEIPQFINVLIGDMSVVGPRPERPEIVVDLKKKVFEYEKRLSVKPGITGLAQVHNRYDKTLADVRKKVMLDLVYIRKMCLFVELSILAKTIRVVFKGKVIA